MNEIGLVPEVVVGWTHNELVFSNTLNQVEITLSGWRPSVSATYPAEILKDALSALNDEQKQKLLAALGSAGFLLDDQTLNITKAETLLWAMPLAQAVAAPSTIPYDKFCLIHTRTEVLVLPTGLSDSIFIEALRLFTSGIRPINLRRCYAFGATTGSVSVVGDECDGARLKAIREQYQAHEQSPFVVSVVYNRDIFAFGTAPGRLHPAQLLIDRRIDLSSEIVLYQSGAAMACPDLRFCDIHPDPWAWGHARNQGLARKKAISEAIERYATGTVPYRQLVYARAADLDAPYLDPRRIVSFTSNQMKRHPELREFLPEDQRYWIPGENNSGKLVYVLADLVYNPFIPPNVDDQRVHCRVSSSGVAYGADQESAKERALLECVERDAFLRVWYGRISPPNLDPRSAGAFAAACVRSLEKRGWNVSLLILPGSVPIIAAVGISIDGLLIGCAAGSPMDATQKALTELSVALTGLPPRQPILPKDIQKAEDHSMLYRDRNMIRHALFLTASKDRYEISDLSWDDGYIDIGDVYFVRLPITTNSSDHVWRSIAPGLIPMTFGYDSEPRGRQDVAQALNGASSSGHSLFCDDDVLISHPFA